MKNLQIITEKNYDVFKLREKNRDITNVRVKNLVGSINELDMTDCMPIVVNERMEIIEGQTRYEACKHLGIPVHYIKKDFGGKSDKAMILLNANRADWTIDEYIEHYVKCNIPIYKEIKECQEKYDISSGVAICFIANTTHGEPSTIRGGKLKRGAIPYNVFGDILMDFKKIYKDYKHVYFIRALIYSIIWGYYDHKQDFHKFELNRYDIVNCANTQQYLAMFEDILNYRRKKGDKVSIMVEYPKIKFDKTEGGRGVIKRLHHKNAA